MDYEEDDHVSDDDYRSDDDNIDDDLTDPMNTPTGTLKSFGHHREKKYTILNEYDIRQRQEDCITEVANVLCVSRAAASILLRKNKWSVNKVHESWFADEEKARKTVGLIENTPIMQKSNMNSTMLCKICYKQVGCKMVHDAGCGHSFCRLCWKDYITRSIKYGAGCLDLRCPNLSCSVPVGQDLIQKVVYAKDNVMYLRYLVRSYIEGNDNIKLCPAAHCDYAVEYKYKGSCRGYCDVTCVCTHSFCWNCMEEAHSPVDCDTAANWMSKRRRETETMIWFMANYKPCPKCKQPLESKRVQSANSLFQSVNSLFQNSTDNCRTCICGFVFCWSCLSRWADSGSGHICNLLGLNGADVKIRNMAKSLMDGYTDHYSGKWEANESLRGIAKRQLQELQAVYMETLNNGQGMKSSQHSFITEAWQLIFECRSVLKWTYAYIYYLPKDEKKNQFFEYLQSEAESCLERLQQCAEEELELHLCADGYGPDFNVFREKLSNMTNVTQDLFMKLVQELENGQLVDEGLRGDCTNRRISLTESEKFIVH